jgi:hypothetical protein
MSTVTEFYKSIAFIQADVKHCTEAYVRWMAPIYENNGLKLQCRSVVGNINNVVHSLYPLTSVVSRRSLFIPTKNKWTAYLDNGHQGTDGAAPAHLAILLSCKTVHARHTPPNNDSDNPATILEIYGPTQQEWLNVIRSIAVISDNGRWEFHQEGEAQPFEEISCYKERLIRDRFTGKMLERYLKALHIDAYDPDFYMPDGQSAVLIEGCGPMPADSREFALKD